MISLRQWNQQTITEATENTQIQIRECPKQYPIRKINIVLQAVYSVTAGGTADYVFAPMAGPRMLSNLLFRTGGANIIKDLSGYASNLMTNLWWPQDMMNTWPVTGTTVGAGGSALIQCLFSLAFSDPDMPPPQRDETILIPSRYEDILLQLTFDELADLCSAGDRPYTMTGNLAVMIEQEQNLVITPNDVLREWQESTEVASSGILEIELPRTELITRINSWNIEDGIPFLNPHGFDVVTIDLNNGQTILYEGTPASFGGFAVQDSESVPIVESIYGPIPFSFNMNHDSVAVLDNRAISKWTEKIPVTAAAPAVREVVNHYVGRVPAG